MAPGLVTDWPLLVDDTRMELGAAADQAVAGVRARRPGQLDLGGEREPGDLDPITVGEQLRPLARAAVVPDGKPPQRHELDAVERRPDQRVAPTDRRIGHDDVAHRIAADQQALTADPAGYPFGRDYAASEPRAVHPASLRDPSGCDECSRPVVGGSAHGGGYQILTRWSGAR